MTTRLANNEQTDALVKALKQIAEHAAESDEWQGAEFFAECQLIAQQALRAAGIKFRAKA